MTKLKDEALTYERKLLLLKIIYSICINVFYYVWLMKSNGEGEIWRNILKKYWERY